MEDMASCWISQIDFLDSLSTWFSNGIIFKNFDPEKHRKCSTAQIQLKILRFVGFGYIA